MVSSTVVESSYARVLSTVRHILKS